jgi:hypothetical protein
VLFAARPPYGDDHRTHALRREDRER